MRESSGFMTVHKNAAVNLPLDGYCNCTLISSLTLLKFLKTPLSSIVSFPYKYCLLIVVFRQSRANQRSEGNNNGEKKWKILIFHMIENHNFEIYQAGMTQIHILGYSLELVQSSWLSSNVERLSLQLFEIYF